MNAFPEDYIVHNLPLIVLSGLKEDQNDTDTGGRARNLLSEGGFRIKTDIPPVTGKTARFLLQALLDHDSSERPWHGRGLAQTDQHAVFRIQSAGRTYTLPPRKAPPPPHSPRLRPANNTTSPPPQLILHSPISPLTPSSPLYPDGIMTALWITKHQYRLPSVYMSFFTLISDPNTSILQDNKIKSEINNIRSVLTTTNYKSRLVVVLLGDGEIPVVDIEERLDNMRKATSLDAKSVFYLAANLSQTAVVDFSKGMLNSLYAGCLEYYRDLSKHARRKRNRNVVPQPTIQPSSGTSSPLHLAGWNVRYEFKLAVFAEFRQEMEAASRSYETAYETLFSAEVFETIPSWASTFNEARMLADIIAVRIIRCLLWLGQTTNAVKWWTNHRNRVENLINRRSTGKETYGWEAWQSIWSRTMADLVQRSEVLSPVVQSTSDMQSTPILIDTEKTLPAGQRYSPWESLHHEGYWLNIAQGHTQDRRVRALQLPEEARTSTGHSPASGAANRAYLYDTYVAPEPHEELPLDDKQGFAYSSEIISILNAASQHFSARDQTRMVEILQLKHAMELMRSQSWEDALSMLRTVWESHSWRNSGWWTLLHQVGQGLLVCASEMDDIALVGQLRWQLAHPMLSQRISKTERSEGESGTAEPEQQLRTAMDTEHALSIVLPSLAFATDEGHVGEPIDVQVCLRSIEKERATSFRLLQLKIDFEGGLKPIYLTDDRDEPSSEGTEGFVIEEVELESLQSRTGVNRRASFGAAAAMGADVNLTLQVGQVKVFQMSVIPREAGDISVASLTLTCEISGCEMIVTTSDTIDTLGQWWETRHGRPTSRPCGRQRDAATARVLPKPPKLQISAPDARKVYYTNEQIIVTVQSDNNEEEAISGSVEARLLSPGKNNVVAKWADSDNPSQISDFDSVMHVQRLPARSMKELPFGQNTSHTISINNADEPIDHELEIGINYSLLSNPETKLTKTFTLDLPIIRPFEANFSFHSRLHAEIWPNFFSAQSASTEPGVATGIKQQYLITAVLCSFALEDLVIESASLTVQKVVAGATCTVTPGVLRQTGSVQEIEKTTSTTVQPEGTRRFGFDLMLQKLELGNRQPVAIDVSLEIQWKRTDSEHVNTSILQVPRFLAHGTEPRVLLRVTREQHALDLYRLEYTLENPSLHFLTFKLSMESSEDFAFSGTKSKNLSLVPISRHDVVYRILPNKSKAWIRVHLEVVDAYFGQTLKIQPASDGVRVDKQGTVLVWVE